METKSSFDLNLAIQTWRENLANSPAFGRENLNELESHLRDSVGALQTRGLSAEEAFLIATRRLGHNQRLESEFCKLNRNNIWLGRAMWMLIGIQIWPFFDRLMSGIAGYVFLLGWRNVHHDPSAASNAWLILFSTLIQLAALVVSIFLAWIVLRNCSGKVGQWVARQLPERFSFVICCAIVSSLAFLLLVVAILIPGWGYEFFRGYEFSRLPFADPMRVGSVIGLSQSLIVPLRLVGFAVLTLLIARKQFVTEQRHL